MLTTSIAHFRTGIGNFVLFTPALRAIASMDPSGQVDICTDANWIDNRKEGLCDIWERLPFIQNVYCTSDTFEKTYKTWFWARWSTCGQARELFSAMKPYPDESWDHNEVHESDYYFSIVQKYYGYKAWKPTQLIIPADEPILDTGKKKIVLCNGSFGHIGAFKKWPHFKQLAAMIRNYYGDSVSIIKVGYKDELEEVVDYDLDFVKKLSITQTAKVMQQADLMITTDTGNMHIADALGVPMIVFWGGSSLFKNKPYNSMSKILHMGYGCQPCQNSDEYKKCPDIKCLANIEVGEVMYNIRKFFNEGKFL